jgi:hypothetical protein
MQAVLLGMERLHCYVVQSLGWNHRHVAWYMALLLAGQVVLQPYAWSQACRIHPVLPHGVLSSHSFPGLGTVPYA